MALPTGNRIFDRARDLGLTAVCESARVVTTTRAQIITTERRSMQSVDFPVSALFSIVGAFEDGTTAEITTIGQEGFVEVDAALHYQIALRTSVCLVSGDCIQLTLEEFQSALSRYQQFADLVYHAVRVRGFMTEQLTLCGIRHSVEQRLARWLLLATYKLASDELEITQEVIAGILGARRAGISEAAAAMARSGAIEYSRGRIMVKDRSALQGLSCSCYALCRDEIESLL